MRKQYNSAPLPFVGQKRMFAKEFKKVLEQFPDGTTFVDLFGGSGLLSHIAKCQKPHSKVVYNDFDGYRLRLEHIPQTNELLAELRKSCRVHHDTSLSLVMHARKCLSACKSTRIVTAIWTSLPYPPLLCFQ